MAYDKRQLYMLCVLVWNYKNDNKKNKSQNSAGNIGKNDCKFYDVFYCNSNLFLCFYQIFSRIYWFFREFKEKVRENRKYFKKQKTLTIETIYRNRPNVLNLINMNYKKRFLLSILLFSSIFAVFCREMKRNLYVNSIYSII